jgi:hypothetical protein
MGHALTHWHSARCRAREILYVFVCPVEWSKSSSGAMVGGCVALRVVE